MQTLKQIQAIDPCPTAQANESGAAHAVEPPLFIESFECVGGRVCLGATSRQLLSVVVNATIVVDKAKRDNDEDL
jgi:hypothetical protein